MPTPREDESKNEFISRCVPIVEDEDDKGDWSNDRLIAHCAGIYEQSKKSRSVLMRAGDYIFNQILADEGVMTPTGSPLTYRCYGVLFGDKSKRDLYGTWFDSDTKYHLDWFSRRPWLYHHGMHPELRPKGLSKVGEWTKVGMDDVGVFLEGELDAHHEYLDALAALGDEGLLYPSSGTLDYYAVIGDDGYIREWPIVEVSSTVTPAEWRMESASPVAQRAYEGLTKLDRTKGGIYIMSWKDKLDQLLNRSAADEDEETPEAVDEVEEEAPASEEVPDVEDSEPETEDVEEPRSVDTETLARAIEAVDEGIATIESRIGDLEEIVVGLAESREEQLTHMAANDSWFNRLHSVSRSTTPNDEEEVSEDEQAALNQANNSPASGDSSGGVFGAISSRQ